MKQIFTLAAAGAAVVLSSCIPSVNPFYTEKDVLFDARLVDEWQEKDKADDPEIWKFEKAEDNAYKLTVTEKGKQGTFKAHLFKLKDEWFLDLIPTDCDYATNQADLVAVAMFPGHLLLRASAPEKELKLAFFNVDWLEKYLAENPKALAHHIEDKHIILTAESSELQSFILKHLAKGELFDEPGVLVHKTSETKAAAPPTQSEAK